MKAIQINFRLMLILAFTILFCNRIYSQTYSAKKRYMFGTFHTKNTTINGISVGAYFTANKTKKLVKTNGIRLETSFEGFVVGVLTPFFGMNQLTEKDSIRRNFTKQKYKFDEVINGINISTGTIGDIKFNGITLGISQSGTLLNGISIAGMANEMNTSNGLQIAIYSNFAFNTKGLQIAAYNGSESLEGIQIGLLGNYAEKVRGIQIGGFNKANILKGVQIGLYNNLDNYTEISGLQIGLYNKSSKTNGIQIGLWNVNEKRSLPIINWNF